MKKTRRSTGTREIFFGGGDGGGGGGGGGGVKLKLPGKFYAHDTVDD